MTNTRSRKYQITINNNEEKGYTGDKIEEIIKSYGDSLVYACFSMEIGLQEHTPHVHIYLQFKNARYFSSMKKDFQEGHIEMAKGTAQENRDYIRKEGKYQNSEKKETSLIDTFREYGELPIEEQGKRNDLSILKEMIEDGCSNKEIIDYNPNYIKRIDDFDKIRNAINESKYSDKFRMLEVTYISGKSRTGKSRYVLDKYGYGNVYRVTNYKHPFDSYKGQDIIVFEEFRSSLPIEDMLKYLEGYPLELPARYYDRPACYTKVFIITNIPFEKQYEDALRYELETFIAFRNRINHFIEFTGEKVKYYEDYDDYKSGFNYIELDIRKENNNEK